MHRPDIGLGHHAVGTVIGSQLAKFFVEVVVAAGFFPVPGSTASQTDAKNEQKSHAGNSTLPGSSYRALDARQRACRLAENGNVKNPENRLLPLEILDWTGLADTWLMPFGKNTHIMYGNVQIAADDRSTIDSGAYSPPRWAPVALAR